MFGCEVSCVPRMPSSILAPEQEKSKNDVEKPVMLLMRLEAMRRPLLVERWQGGSSQVACPVTALNELGLPSPAANESPMETMMRFWSAATAGNAAVRMVRRAME